MNFLSLGLASIAILTSVGAILLWQSKRKLSVRLKPITDLDEELVRLRNEIQTSRDSSESELARLESEIREGEASLKARRLQWETEYTKLTQALESVSSDLDHAQDLSEMQSYGLYEPVFDFDSSAVYKQKLAEVRANQKELVRQKAAAVCMTEWSVEGSKRKGQVMINRQLKLMLRAFNGECDTAISKAKFNNVVALDERIRRAFKSINALGASNQCLLTDDYLAEKVAELQLNFELARKKQQEKEEQSELRQQMREEERVRKEVAAAERDAEKAEATFAKALSQAHEELRKQGSAEENAKTVALRKKIQILESQLENAHESKVSAIARGRLTKSGHVYVISNIGSFGTDVYKIGMTRRLVPIDRVKELGDASVPFRFDVHAMIYADDAPALENRLHARFADRQVNLVNSRKEFFRVTLDEVQAAVEQEAGEVEFVRTAVAEEYRESAAMRERLAAERNKAARVAEDLAVHKAKSRLEELKADWVAEPI